jgi:hypothetical protein
LLTHSALLDLLHRDPKNGQNFNYYLNDHIHHFRGRWHLRVHLETSKKTFNALKDVHKSVLACTNVSSRLINVFVTIASAKKSRIHTERRTPIPVKITFAGANTCQINMRVKNSDKRKNLGIPGQHPLQLSQKMQKGHLWLDQAILPIDRRCSQADPDPGLVAEGQQEWRRENHRFETERREDGRVDPVWCVFRTLSRHY